MADSQQPPKPAAEKAPDAAAQPSAAPDAKKKGGAKPKFALPVLKPRENMIFKVFLFFFIVLVVDLVLIHPLSNYLRQLDESIRMKEEVIPKRLLILKYK